MRTMEDFIKDMLTEVSLKDIVEKRAKLIPNGLNKYKCLSPLTQENTPSFYVDDSTDKRFWYCWSTKQGGGILKYLELAEGMSKGEAIRWVAETYGIKLPDSEKKDEDVDLKEVMRSCLKEAHKFFRSNSTKAVEYVKSRNYPEEVVDKYELGYAPESWDDLKNYLLSAGFSEDIMIKCGLLSKGKNNNTYNRYRDRVMFPLRDIYGGMVGFTGRACGPVDGEKYLHVPNSPLFTRSNTLYNYHQARSEIKSQGRVFVCEGTFDALIADYFGFPAVATLGSEVNNTQLKVLAGACSDIFMTFDSDEAGRRGMVNMFKKIEENNYNVITYAVTLVGYKDVADFITSKGAKAFNDSVGRAVPDTSIVVEYYRELHYEPKMTKAALSRKVLSDILPMLSKMQYSYRTLDLIDRTAQVLGMDHKALERWVAEGGQFTHNSSVYKKIDSISFPAEIYERRIMTECMKDYTNWSILKAMGLGIFDFDYLPSKVLAAIENVRAPELALQEIQESLTEEEYHVVMSAYTQSFNEHLDIHTLGAIMVSRVKKRRGDGRLSPVLGRPLRESKKKARAALAGK